MYQTFNCILLVQPLMNSFSIVVALFCVMAYLWYPGVGFVIFAYTQLFSMCTVGQTIQNNVIE